MRDQFREEAAKLEADYPGDDARRALKREVLKMCQMEQMEEGAEQMVRAALRGRSRPAQWQWLESFREHLHKKNATATGTAESSGEALKALTDAIRDGDEVD